MIRTQIQLPDALYRDLKRLAAAKEWTLAETLRRASEHWLEIHSPDRIPVSTWKPPGPLSLGAFRSGPESWRELANLASMAVGEDQQ
jgi:hypothetical protein